MTWNFLKELKTGILGKLLFMMNGKCDVLFLGMIRLRGCDVASSHHPVSQNLAVTAFLLQR